MRILLAEDDAILGDGLRAGLRQAGFQVDWVRDGVAVERELLGEVYAAAVLDLGLPLKDGLAVLRDLRLRKLTTPILVLTSRDAVSDRVTGLDSGADDYVLKPVDLTELAARVRSLVRRSQGQVQDRLECAGVVLDVSARRVTRDGVVVQLSTREFDLVQTLLRSVGRVLSREQLEQQMYSWGYEVESNTIEVHIHHLRRKLGSGLIRTVRGVGYVVQRTSQEA